MKVIKLIVATLLATIFSIIFGMITCGGYFSWIYEIEPTNVWKPIEQFSFPVYLVATLYVDFVFVLTYSLLSKSVPGQNMLTRGISYGLIVWAVGIIPGMISTYLFMTVAKQVIIYWTIWGFVSYLFKGLIVSGIYSISKAPVKDETLKEESC